MGLGDSIVWSIAFVIALVASCSVLPGCERSTPVLVVGTNARRAVDVRIGGDAWERAGRRELRGEIDGVGPLPPTWRCLDVSRDNPVCDGSVGYVVEDGGVP